MKNYVIGFTSLIITCFCIFAIIREMPLIQQQPTHSHLNSADVFWAGDGEDWKQGASLQHSPTPTIQLRRSGSQGSNFAVFLWEDEVILQVIKGNEYRQVELWDFLGEEATTRNVYTRQEVDRCLPSSQSQ